MVSFFLLRAKNILLYERKEMLICLVLVHITMWQYLHYNTYYTY